MPPTPITYFIAGDSLNRDIYNDIVISLIKEGHKVIFFKTASTAPLPEEEIQYLSIADSLLLLPRPDVCVSPRITRLVQHAHRMGKAIERKLGTHLQTIPLDIAVSNAILVERYRQQYDEGVTLIADSYYKRNELSRAAAGYLTHRGPKPPQDWPWDSKKWKPGTEKEQLIKAAALIAARLAVIEGLET